MIHMRTIRFPVLLLLIACLLAGCGKEESLEKYYNEINAFSEDINTEFAVLNNIDPASETAVDEMLAILDELAVSFRELAEIEVPREFSANESLADEASEYMAEAAKLYHDAYVDGNYDSYAADAAQENYNRAVKRLSYISMILQGEMPEDESITIITETETSGFTGDEE